MFFVDKNINLSTLFFTNLPKFSKRFLFTIQNTSMVPVPVPKCMYVKAYGVFSSSEPTGRVISQGTHTLLLLLLWLLAASFPESIHWIMSFKKSTDYVE